MIGYGTSHEAGAKTLNMFLNNVTYCGCCELCDNLKQIKDQPYTRAFLNTEIRKVGKEIIVHRAKGDNHNKSGNFVRDTLKLNYETCAAHAGPIMQKK